jgi:cytoskeletal protein CcmA (bactofilin family)
MFTKKPARVGAGAQRGASLPNGGPPRLPAGRPAQPARASGVTSIIGADLKVTGNLESTGEVWIEGEVQGDIRAGRILVGAEATITGALVADEIVIGGNVQGSIRGNKVTFQSASHIEGDVYHRSLAVEQGAYFEGKSRRADHPMAVEYEAYGALPKAG